MLIDLNFLKIKYKLNINGIIHIGANDGHEIKDYVNDNVKKVLFVEPLPHIYEKLLSNILPFSENIDVQTFNIALGNDTTNVNFCVSNNNGMSSSVLQPNLHLSLHPDVNFNGIINVPMDKLDNLKFEKNNYNFINIDVQGFELEVFKGAIDTLPYIDYIYSEVNSDYVYSNCALIHEIDEFLKEFGFIRVETKWWDDTYPWGDAFYIKHGLIEDVNG